MRVVKRLVKRMVVIFPFEEKIYRDAGVPVNFVGHPLVDVVRPTMTRAEFASRHGLDAGRPIVTLLPGSRRSEIARNFPRCARCVRRSCEGAMRGRDVQFVHAAAPGLGAELLHKIYAARARNEARGRRNV